MSGTPPEKPQPQLTAVKWERPRLYQNERGEWCMGTPPKTLN